MVPAEEYNWLCLLRGEKIAAALSGDDTFMLPEIPAFVECMNQTGAWELVPILLAMSESGPPLEERLFRGILAEIEERLSASLDLDGIYVAAHGAVRAQQTLDAEGALLARIRDIVGPAVPIVVTLDLHGKLSRTMVSMSNLLIGYRTNPHIDMAERGTEAALAMRQMLTGRRPTSALVRVPILLPQVSMSTLRGPFAQLMEEANANMGGEIANISILGGFSFLDTPYCGINIVVSTWGSAQHARALAAELGERAWTLCREIRPRLCQLERAVALALRAGERTAEPPICLADVADNPGGGGRGNTTFILEALFDAGAQGVALGPFWDPAAAANAHELGLGATFDVTLNAHEQTEFARQFSARARIAGLSDGRIRVALSPGKGVLLEHGPMAALDFGGITVVVSSRRFQTLSPDQFEATGVKLRDVRTLVVKSRGHFRATFERLFHPDNIFEVDVPGLTTPNIELIPFKNVQRPIVPLDWDMHWDAHNKVELID